MFISLTLLWSSESHNFWSWKKSSLRGRGGERDINRQSPIFFMFSIITLPFCSTLALIAIPMPTALGLQRGGPSRDNRSVLFFYKRKKKKNSSLVMPGAQLSIIIGSYLRLVIKSYEVRDVGCPWFWSWHINAFFRFSLNSWLNKSTAHYYHLREVHGHLEIIPFQFWSNNLFFYNAIGLSFWVSFRMIWSQCFVGVISMLSSCKTLYYCVTA